MFFLDISCMDINLYTNKYVKDEEIGYTSIKLKRYHILRVAGLSKSSLCRIYLHIPTMLYNVLDTYYFHLLYNFYLKSTHDRFEFYRLPVNGISCCWKNEWTLPNSWKHCCRKYANNPIILLHLKRRERYCESQSNFVAYFEISYWGNKSELYYFVNEVLI